METLGEPFFRYERRRDDPAPVRTALEVASHAGSERALALALTRRPRAIPPKYFYDHLGSALYEQICRTPEYYPARVEEQLLREVAGEIIGLAQPQSVVELGSGSSRKTRHLLAACADQGQRVCYIPVDVCGDMLAQAGNDLQGRFPWLTIKALIGDYDAALRCLPPTRGPRLFLFLGGSIGNFTDPEILAFLHAVRAVMSPGDWFLLGADRVKDPAVLHAAYNDAGGYTAAFNLNVLNVLNREFGAGFDVRQFAHLAWYNTAASRIEMYLRSRRRQRVSLGRLGREIVLAEDERILTEISRKFSGEALAGMLALSGFVMERHLEAPDHYFSLALVRPAHYTRA